MIVKTLIDVEPEKAFRFCNNSRALNLYQLVDTIEHTDDGIFTYHVTSRHDFATWIKDVIADEPLFHYIKEERDKRWFVAKVRFRIKELEERLQPKMPVKT